MEIIFISKGLSEKLMDEPLQEINSEEYNAILEQLKAIDKTLIIKEVNLGLGADWIAILVIINSIANVLLVGDKLVKGIDGLIEIGKRIKKIFNKSKKVYIDKDAATVLAIEFLSKSEKIFSIKKINEEIIALKDLSEMLTDRTNNDFIAKPYNVYLQTYEINDNKLKILGIRSDGKIKELYSFEDIREPYIPF